MWYTFAATSCQMTVVKNEISTLSFFVTPAYAKWCLLTLFQAGSGTYVTRRGGAIMARIDLRRYRFTQRPPTTLNLLPDKYFDLWLSIDTKNSPLCGLLLPLRATK